jgi:hypothetical protein
MKGWGMNVTECWHSCFCCCMQLLLAVFVWVILSHQCDNRWVLRWSVR